MSSQVLALAALAALAPAAYLWSPFAHDDLYALQRTDEVHSVT